MFVYKNINNEKMKKINLKVVLDTVREKEPISRKELAEVVGLTSSSITNIIGTLINEGYIVQTGSGESSGGRKPIMLELNSNARYAVGVELTVERIVCLVTDFKAKKLVKNEIPTQLQEGKDKVIERLVGAIEKTIEDARIGQKQKIMGIGLVSAGPYDHSQGIMIDPPNFPGWNNVPIKNIVTEATGIPTYFEKESVGAAMGEYWFGSAPGVESFFAICVNIIGIGGGAIINGQVYHGFRDGAADIGHMVIDLDGPACSCGNYGCLEAVASGVSIVKYVKAELKMGEESIVKDYADSIEQIDFEMVARAAGKGDNLCRRMIEKSAKYMGIAISNIINAYSPDTIVIGGRVAEMCPYYVQISMEYAKRRTYPYYNKEVHILPASFGSEQGAMGGVGMVFQEFFRKLED